MAEKQPQRICKVLRDNARKCREMADRAKADSQELEAQAAEYDRIADELGCPQ